MKKHFYLVSQNVTFNHEMSHKILWSPLRSSNGHKVNSYECMKNIHKGDIILHAYNKHIVAISVAREDSEIGLRPNNKAFDKWKNNGKKGWLVNLFSINLNNINDSFMLTKSLISSLRRYKQDKNDAFNKDNTLGEHYLSKLTKGETLGLLKHIPFDVKLQINIGDRNVQHVNKHSDEVHRHHQKRRNNRRTSNNNTSPSQNKHTYINKLSDGELGELNTCEELIHDYAFKDYTIYGKSSIFNDVLLPKYKYLKENIVASQNDSAGYDYLVKDNKSNKCIFVDSKATVSKSTNFYMSSGEKEILDHVKDSKNKAYQIYQVFDLRSEKEPPIRIYSTDGDKELLNSQFDKQTKYEVKPNRK